MKKNKIEIIRLECSCCGKIFYKCRRCYRNNCYCSEKCRKSGLRECQKKAKKIYRKTEKGKKQHAASEKKRRSKKKRLIKQPLKKYQSCMCIMMNLLQKYKRETKAKCQSCEIEGEVMEKFSKRGY